MLAGVMVLTLWQHQTSHSIKHLVAFQGLVVMSGELEAAYRSISMAKVPDLWARVSYPSLKPLPSYLEDLYARLAMLQVRAVATCS